MDLPEAPSVQCRLKSLKDSEMKRAFSDVEAMKVNL